MNTMVCLRHQSGSKCCEKYKKDKENSIYKKCCTYNITRHSSCGVHLVKTIPPSCAKHNCEKHSDDTIKGPKNTVMLVSQQRPDAIAPRTGQVLLAWKCEQNISARKLGMPVTGRRPLPRPVGIEWSCRALRAACLLERTPQRVGVFHAPPDHESTKASYSSSRVSSRPKTFCRVQKIMTAGDKAELIAIAGSKAVPHRCKSPH